MKRAINQWAFPGGMPSADAMSRAKSAGFEGFEVCIGVDGPVRLDASESEFTSIRRHAASIGIDITSLACALGFEYPLTSPDAATAARAIEIQEKALQAAQWLGVDTLLLVPGVVSAEITYDAAIENARRNIGTLIRTAENLRVTIGIENVWNKFLLSPIEFRDFVDGFGSAYVGAWFDTGNILLYGFPEQWVRILGSRIRRVHVKDFRTGVGTLDGFVMLQEGDVNWPAVMSALRDTGYDGPLIAEYGPYRYGTDTLLAQIAAGLKEIIEM
jgi:hexulose-6-phosphate isomerase